MPPMPSPVNSRAAESVRMSPASQAANIPIAAKLAQGRIAAPISSQRLVTGELDETVVERTDAIALSKRLEPLSPL